MIWLLAPANYVKGHIVPLNQMCTKLEPVLASINTCFKLDSGLHLPDVSGLAGVEGGAKA